MLPPGTSQVDFSGHRHKARISCRSRWGWIFWVTECSNRSAMKQAWGILPALACPSTDRPTVFSNRRGIDEQLKSLANVPVEQVRVALGRYATDARTTTSGGGSLKDPRDLGSALRGAIELLGRCIFFTTQSPSAECPPPPAGTSKPRSQSMLCVLGPEGVRGNAATKERGLLQDRCHVPVNPHVVPFADRLLNTILDDVQHVRVSGGVAIEC